MTHYYIYVLPVLSVLMMLLGNMFLSFDILCLYDILESHLLELIDAVERIPLSVEVRDERYLDCNFVFRHQMLQRFQRIVDGRVGASVALIDVIIHILDVDDPLIDAWSKQFYIILLTMK